MYIVFEIESFSNDDGKHGIANDVEENIQNQGKFSKINHIIVGYR
jgi:hypothetical protein